MPLCNKQPFENLGLWNALEVLNDEMSSTVKQNLFLYIFFDETTCIDLAGFKLQASSKEEKLRNIVTCRKSLTNRNFEVNLAVAREFGLIEGKI